MIAEFYYLYEDRTWEDGHFFLVPDKIDVFGLNLDLTVDCVTPEQLVHWWSLTYGVLPAYRKVVTVVLADTNLDDKSPWFNPDAHDYVLENEKDIFVDEDPPS